MDVAGFPGQSSIHTNLSLIQKEVMDNPKRTQKILIYNRTKKKYI